MKKLIFFLVCLIFIPCFIINNFFKYQEKVISGFNTNYIDKKIRVLRKNGNIENMNLEEYLVGVVSSEVPVSFLDEAIKSQAVASRTYALKQMENSINKDYDVTDDILSQVYLSNDELKDKWKDKYNENYNRIKKDIELTKGEYLSYNNDYIYAFFFSCSNGMTEDNKNVFGKDLPYLKPVDSKFDEEENPNFINIAKINKKEFYNKLNIEYSDKLNINNIIKTNTNRIYSLYINNNYFKGRDFQKKLNLKSNDFEINEDNYNIIIKTKGFGHGVGLSQYGANALAKKNKTYKEILKYYYKNIDIKKL